MTSMPDLNLPVSSPAEPLQVEMPVWPLFWRVLLAGIGHAFIVPSPWTSTMLCRFLVEQTALPDGRRLKFTGQPGDIWYLFIAIAALSWFHEAANHLGVHRSAGLLGLLIGAYLTVLMYRWACANVKSEDGRVDLSFGGEPLAYLGWTLLLILSFVTIIGWAWVGKFVMQWICRNVQGTLKFDFTATGWQILWRVLVFGLLTVLIVPIPWTIRWFTRWMVSQVSVVPSPAATA